MKILQLAVLSILIMTIGCTTQITPNVSVQSWTGKMEIVDDQYRSAGSSSVVLGSYGRVLTEGKNRYQRDGILTEDFKTRKPRIIQLSFDNVSKIEKLGFRLSEQAKANINYTRENKGEYGLFVITLYDPSVFEKQLIKRFTSDSFLREKMKNPDFRYIVSVAYIVDYDATKGVDWSIVGDANIDRITEGLKLEVNLGQDNETTVKLPDTQIIAYQFRRLCWKDGKLVDTVKDLIGGDAKACGLGVSVYPGTEK